MGEFNKRNGARRYQYDGMNTSKKNVDKIVRSLGIWTFSVALVCFKRGLHLEISVGNLH